MLPSRRYIHRIAAATGLVLAVLAGPAAAKYPLSVGCPWFAKPINKYNKNIGYLDAYATYPSMNLPNAGAGDGVTVQIHGQYPKAAYFSFQTAAGFQLGNLYDQIADWQLVSDHGRGPGTPAQLAPGRVANDDDTYTLTVKFEDIPQPPAVRAPNTLYAGAKKQTIHSRQVVMRIYLPDVGADELGGVPLPDLTYTGPEGTIDLDETPDKITCNIMSALIDTYAFLLVPAIPSPVLWFAPVSVLGDAWGWYPNGDSVYLRTQPSLAYGPMVVVHARAPSFPLPPPATGPADPDVRYWSLCQNALVTTANVGCIADRDMLLQSDGTFTAVISPPANRPATADAAHGINWLDWGSSPDAFVVIRQILSRPGFDGDYNKALAQPTKSVKETLGEWAPLATYCDKATFDAHVAEGGAAVFQACKAAFPGRVPKL